MAGWAVPHLSGCFPQGPRSLACSSPWSRATQNPSKRAREKETNCQALAETQNGYGETFHGMAMRRTRILAPNPGSAHMLLKRSKKNQFDIKEVVD